MIFFVIINKCCPDLVMIENREMQESTGTGNGERGNENGERRTENGERGTGTGNGERYMGHGTLGTGNMHGFM